VGYACHGDLRNGLCGRADCTRRCQARSSCHDRLPPKFHRQPNPGGKRSRVS
jgi:hypothetical protein